MRPDSGFSLGVSNQRFACCKGKLQALILLWASASVSAFELLSSSLRPSMNLAHAHGRILLLRSSLYVNPDDSADRAEPLPLTAHDLQRLQQLKARHYTMPIMILDAMLPRQKFSFKSDDPKFRHLIEHCLNKDQAAVGMIGLNPHTGRPISRGVTLSVTDDTITVDGKVITMEATGHKRMEVQGEPWLDETGSFYVADVELVEDRIEVLTEEQQSEVNRLSKTLPSKVQEWVAWVLKAGATDQAGMDARLSDLGRMPKDPTDRAFWVAALINPLPALGVCLEIRPAMLSCSNDLDRMILVCQAVQSSIDHLSGKHRLF